MQVCTLSLEDQPPCSRLYCLVLHFVDSNNFSPTPTPRLTSARAMPSATVRSYAVPAHKKQRPKLFELLEAYYFDTSWPFGGGLL